MKVICIKDDWKTLAGNPNGKDPKKDEICTVIQSFAWEDLNCYLLTGYPAAYCSKGFVPLDEYLDKFSVSLTKELEQLQKQPCFTNQQMMDRVFKLFKDLGWNSIDPQ